MISKTNTFVYMMRI